MTRSIEATGRTIENAIENALNILNADRNDVSVEVLDKNKPGFFGIGGTLARVKVTFEVSRSKKALDFLSGLLTRMGVRARAVVESESDDMLSLKLEGENLGLLIGRRGDTLNALQHITSYVVNRGEEERVRVVVDIENYRQKREEALKRLAEKTASKVLRYKRSISLEPMNAYERHVVHTALSEYRGVTTFSSGNEPRRCVVIAPAAAGGARQAPVKARREFPQRPARKPFSPEE